MSGHLYTPAYATRLGNLTAKSVLVRICDQANDSDGICWPSFATIARDTEISRRTVLRMVEVFAAMGLLEVKKMTIKDRYGERTVQGIVLNLSKLGMDLTEEFARCYADAQSKTAVLTASGRWCLRDAERDVSETQSDVSETRGSVSETQNSVSETHPPDPLLGRSLTDPSPDPALIQRAREDLDAKQQEHLDRLAAEGKPVHSWREYYLAENRKACEAAEAEAAKERELQREYPDLQTALRKVRLKCGFSCTEGDELGPMLAQVFRDQEEMGKPYWRTAPQMVSAWELQREQGPRLRARYGPMKFFRDGHWLNPAGWHWNTELLAQQAGASVGSAR